MSTDIFKNGLKGSLDKTEACYEHRVTFHQFSFSLFPFPVSLSPMHSAQGRNEGYDIDGEMDTFK